MAGDRLDAPPGRRALGLGVAAALALVVLAGAVVARTAPQHVLLPAPEPGEGFAEWLPDGTPVFVVRDRHGDKAVHVVRAREPWRGMDVAVVWCRPAGAFLAEWTGSRFANDGSAVGGPAAAGLTTYDAEVMDGETRVGAARPPRPRGDPPPAGGTARCDTPPSVRNDDRVDHGWADQRVWSVERALHERPDASILVRALLLRQPDGVVVLCHDTGGQGPCDGPSMALGEGVEAWPPHLVLRGLVHGRLDGNRLGDPLLVRVLGGAVSMGSTDGVAAVADDASRSLHVTAEDLAFRGFPAEVQAGAVDVRLSNAGGIWHTLHWEGGAQPELKAPPGGSAGRAMDLGPGRYVLFCALPGHREAGMEFTVTVR